MGMKLGFIGLGIMGRPMALNLRKGGHELSVYARRAQMAKPLIDASAVGYASPREVAAASDVTFVMVSDTPDVEQVILGKDGVLSGARAGSAIVDMSSISPIATRVIAMALSQKGVDMLDAPVSGGETGAIDGTLSIMAGGKEAVFRRVLPLFQLIGRNIVHVGDHGAGQTAKVCNQVVVAVTIAASHGCAKHRGE